MYTDILLRLRDAVRRKCPEIWKSNIWFLHHDNAPAHRSVSVNYFLANNNAAKLKHRPQSLDLAPADFYPFPRLKSALKGRRFCDVTDIIKKVTEKLKRI
jgi:hypothetical protein